MGHAARAAIAPSRSRARSSWRVIRAKASSHTKSASNTSTGTSATPQCRLSVRRMLVIVSKDLKRGHPLGLAVMAVAPAAGRTDRQDHGQSKRDGEGEVKLRADVGIMMPALVGRLGRHEATEDRRTHVAQEDSRSPDLREADGRQVDLAGQLGKAACFDLVDRKAGEALHFAVPLHRPVIDVIVAERAEIE